VYNIKWRMHEMSVNTQLQMSAVIYNYNGNFKMQTNGQNVTNECI